MSLTPRGTAAGGTAAEQGSVAAGQRSDQGRRSAGARLLPTFCAGFLFLLFMGLGTWQVERLQWKLKLIQRVNERVNAAPITAPGPALWPRVTAASDEYRHVVLSGTFLYQSSTKVQATTELGSGFWLLTPLCGSDGSMVLVNRGFVPARPEDYAPAVAARAAAVCPASVTAPVSIDGLLRVSEPNGGFLHHNDPSGNRWYSRDVAAIAARDGFDPARVAPYFVDAAAHQEPAGAPGDVPTGGLTVISFHNSHLVYAFTWYALALMTAGAYCWIRRSQVAPEHEQHD